MLGEDNRFAPSGGTLLNLGRPVRPDGPGEPAAGVRSGRAPGRPAASEPSWGRVLVTTFKLWVLRRWRVAAGVTAAAAVTLGALAVSGVFTGTASRTATGTATRAARAASTPSPAKAKAVPHRTAAQPSAAQRAQAAAQTAAAAWVAGQLSGDAIVACDPAMCTALQAHGVAAGRLTSLAPGSPGPGGATVVVTSSAAAGGYAAAAGYAPAVIASFGSGAAQVDVRATEPGGASAYQTALRADLAARMSAGTELLRNDRIHFTAQDAAQLRAGEVDARLLATLAALASQYSFSVTAFGDASPGVATVYREVTIAGASKHLTAALALVKAQVPPYLPAQAAIGPPTGEPGGTPAALSVEFAAPSPLGLLSAVLDETSR